MLLGEVSGRPGANIHISRFLSSSTLFMMARLCTLVNSTARPAVTRNLLGRPSVASRSIQVPFTAVLPVRSSFRPQNWCAQAMATETAAADSTSLDSNPIVIADSQVGSQLSRPTVSSHPVFALLCGVICGLKHASTFFSKIRYIDFVRANWEGSRSRRSRFCVGVVGPGGQRGARQQLLVGNGKV